MQLFIRLLLLFSVFSLQSCTKEEPIYNTQSYVFGTLVDITIYGEPSLEAENISSDIMRQFQTLHNRLHAWRPSEIKTLNHTFSKGKSPTSIHADVANMIAEATTLSIDSHGAFNPAIGRLIALWGFQHDEFKPVKIKPNQIQALLAEKPQMVDIVLQDGKAFSNNPAVNLDLGGYAKGYALDQALLYLRKSGVKNALINIGGNIIALGQRGDKPWRVGIQHPRKPEAIATLELPSGWAIGTSGDYQRYFELNGKRYCHIINPETGYPVEGVQSVTVLIPPQSNAGVLSDVTSKPIFIAESSKRAQAAADMHVNDYLVIESADHIFASPAMAKRLTWLDKTAANHVVQVKP
jgi:thiamine biosynthesis lipoprotein